MSLLFEVPSLFQQKSLSNQIHEPRTFDRMQHKTNIHNFCSLGGGVNLRFAIKSYGIINAPWDTIYLFKIGFSIAVWILLSISDPPKLWNRKDWPVWVALGITNFKNSRISNWLKLYWRVCKVRPCRWHISVCTHWPWTVLAVQLGTRTTLRMLRPRIAALQQGAASNSIKAH